MRFDSLFNPKSIAIIGASTRAGSVGNDIVKNLVEQGFAGAVYPVNPKADKLYGRKAYARIGDIREDVDLAIVVVPAQVVPSVAREAAEKGVRAMIVISAGFREVGNGEGEEELREICDKHGVVLLGPNCLGAINPHILMNASFASRMPRPGGIAFLSQSGALCTAVLDYAEASGAGFSKFASMGNKAQLDEAALMEYLAEDDTTKVIALYVEALRDAGRFIEAVRAARSEGKAVLVLKSGRTQAGASASASHTGSLAGNDAVYDALFDQAGAIRVGSIQEMFAHMTVFASPSKPRGKRVAVLTNAGGPGVLVTDAAVEAGLESAKLADRTVEKLQTFLPSAANVHGPVDILGDAKADRYERALELLVADSEVDSIMVVLTPQSMTEIEKTAQAITAQAERTNKPIIASFMGGKDVVPGLDILQRGGVPAAPYPQPMVQALAARAKFASDQDGGRRTRFSFSDIDIERVSEIFSSARAAGKTAFPEAEALKIFEAYGFETLESILVTSAEEAEKAAKKIAAKVVLKIVSQDILHKSDAQGIELDVAPEDAGKKYDELLARVRKNRPDAKLDGALVVEMGSKDGHEFILGSVKDPGLGQAVMVGLGGIYVELFRDTRFAIAPVSREDALRMVRGLKAHKLIEGMRGGPELDEDALVDAIGRISQMLLDHPSIQEIDINPLSVLPKGRGVKVLDARVILE